MLETFTRICPAIALFARGIVFLVQRLFGRRKMNSEPALDLEDGIMRVKTREDRDALSFVLCTPNLVDAHGKRALSPVPQANTNNSLPINMFSGSDEYQRRCRLARCYTLNFPGHFSPSTSFSGNCASSLSSVSTSEYTIWPLPPSDDKQICARHPTDSLHDDAADDRANSRTIAHRSHRNTYQSLHQSTARYREWQSITRKLRCAKDDEDEDEDSASSRLSQTTVDSITADLGAFDEEDEYLADDSESSISLISWPPTPLPITLGDRCDGNDCDDVESMLARSALGDSFCSNFTDRSFPLGVGLSTYPSYLRVSNSMGSSSTSLTSAESVDLTAKGAYDDYGRAWDSTARYYGFDDQSLTCQRGSGRY
ncbi:hypothetical protein BD626DRAFT_506378 [Schizophyllum amplum]|uniref:Uncharacterized protein n=1 Tax=Schizophyllum amplum TaxID=97359 RepID=A0A550C5K7_9AGAR|nr:hypothetical protein BD626DRAFT_506378 [Auriculariopsis ampla]